MTMDGLEHVVIYATHFATCRPSTSGHRLDSFIIYIVRPEPCQTLDLSEILGFFKSITSNSSFTSNSYLAFITCLVSPACVHHCVWFARWNMNIMSYCETAVQIGSKAVHELPQSFPTAITKPSRVQIPQTFEDTGISRSLTVVLWPLMINVKHFRLLTMIYCLDPTLPGC